MACQQGYASLQVSQALLASGHRRRRGRGDSRRQRSLASGPTRWLCLPLLSLAAPSPSQPPLSPREPQSTSVALPPAVVNVITQESGRQTAAVLPAPFCTRGSCIVTAPGTPPVLAPLTLPCSALLPPAQLPTPRSPLPPSALVASPWLPLWPPAPSLSSRPRLLPPARTLSLRSPLPPAPPPSPWSPLPP
eukprot:5808941-Prymnesium_polylepis.1